MSDIHIIAGPPGIGKSTMGFDFIESGLDILNEDEIRFKYKDRGFVDYNEYSIHRVRDLIKGKLIRNEDFALELNLGFQHQYDYVLSAKSFNRDNTLNIVLFYTDALEFCQKRARIRHESGLHLVRPEIIDQMYHNTIPLLKNNFSKIDTLLFVDVGLDNTVTVVASYSREKNMFNVRSESTRWFNNDLKPFISQQLQLKLYSGSTIDTLNEEKSDTTDAERRRRR